MNCCEETKDLKYGQVVCVYWVGDRVRFYKLEMWLS